MAETQSCYAALNKNLREIRLLTIQPDSHPQDNRIQCSLSIHNLDDNPKYEALSYAWGDVEENDFKIWLDGAWIGVRRNLLCALRVLRNEQPRIVWIDALCINQSDVMERGHQVGLMGPIYQRAARVLAWIGATDASELHDKHLDSLSFQRQSVAMPAFQLLEASQIAQSCPNFDPRYWGHEFIPYTHTVGRKWSEGFIQLRQLCHANYWDRLWIIQEVCLAAKILLLYGSMSVEWTQLAQYLRLVDSFNFLPWQIPGWIAATQAAKLRRIMEHHSLRTLSTLIEISVDCLCQDGRDKVYGILALATDVTEHDIRVDYSQDKTDLFRSVLMFQGKKAAHDLREMKIAAFRRLLNNSMMLAMDADRSLKYIASDIRSDRLTDGTYSPVVQLSHILTEDTLFLQDTPLNRKRWNDAVELRRERVSPSVCTDLRNYWKSFVKARCGEPLNESYMMEEAKIFITQDDFVGLSQRDIRDGDVLCCLSTTIVRPDGSRCTIKSNDWPLLAIIRKVESQNEDQAPTWSFVGGAVLSDQEIFDYAVHSKTLKCPLVSYPWEVNVCDLPKDILDCCERALMYQLHL